jgi:hypothetical protein
MFFLLAFAPVFMIYHVSEHWSHPSGGVAKEFLPVGSHMTPYRISSRQSRGRMGDIVLPFNPVLAPSQSSQGNKGEKSSPTGHIVPSRHRCIRGKNPFYVHLPLPEHRKEATRLKILV